MSHELAAIAKKGRRVLRSIGDWPPFLPSSPFSPFASDGGAWESLLAAWENRSLSLPSLPLSAVGAPLHRRFGFPFTVRSGEESIAFDGRSALNARVERRGGAGPAPRRRRVSDK